MKHHDDMRACREYIQAHLDEEIEPEKLAELFYMSYSRFRAVFFEINGMTVHAFIRNRRLNRAAKELRSGKKVNSVSLDCGFRTLSGFSRAFKQLFGVSPSEYMRTRGAIIQKEPFIEDREPFIFAAYTFNRVTDKVSEAEVPAWWQGQDFSTVPLSEYKKIAVDGYAEIGAWLKRKKNVRVYAFGPAVKDGSYIPKGMAHVQLPGGLYAGFPVPEAEGVHQLCENVRSTVEYAGKVWLPDSPYTKDRSRGLFERYEGRESFVYVPVKERGAEPAR
ncbi:MAG: AraC family transcriptional regulator [Oscillospiraceae bacterium]|nr:AraC family transcriptional regulator [Oscillospiraceae bacterium]